MSVAGIKNTILRKIPRWESQLWSYVSRGDGVYCPVYSLCQFRRRGGWCISDDKERLEKLLDSRQFNPSNYDFVDHMTPCGIFKLVETLAQSMLRKGKGCCPPVPAELVSLADEQHPVEVRLVPLKCHRGAIWRLKDSWVIQLNENDSPSARRFTLFHEAFHILAHTRATPVFRKRNSEMGCFNELLAEYFAACILMPRKWVKERWVEVKGLDRMAEIFDVEKSLMWIRLREMGLV